MVYNVIESPLGPILISCDGECVNRIQFVDCKKPNPIDETWKKSVNNPTLKEAKKQLDLYFSGKLQEFLLPLSMQGTEFQITVWKALTTIPYGKTWSYKKLAENIGKPTAYRAVGNANGKNPLSIVVP